MMLRESEETSGSMSIEEYLVRSDPFRSTTIHSPLPYPLKLRPAPEALKARVERFYPDIDYFLRSRHISRFTFSFMNVSKPGYPGGDIPVATLRIKIYDEGIDGLFGQIKDEAKRILKMQGFQQIPIEVVNPEKCFQPSLFAIRPNDPTVPMYRHIRDDAVQALRNAIGIGWQAMCLFLVGITEGKANLAIVVTVQPTTVYDWARLEGILNIHLIRYKPRNMTINVEFLPGYCRELPPQESTSMAGESFAHRMAADCHPEMGYSIEVRGEEGGGTLGGFVRLEVGDKIHRGFMTSYHVIRPPRQAAADIKPQADRYGSSYYVPTSKTRTHVHYFAIKDIEPTKKDLERSIKEKVQDIDKMREEQRNREIAQMRPCPYLQDDIKWAQGMVNSYLKMLFKDMPKELGRVLMTSKGYTEEFVILSKKQGTAAHMQASFCRPGDSGSFVIDKKGYICGLLYGEVTGWCGQGDPDAGSIYIGAGLVSCMSKVQASIQQKLTRFDTFGTESSLLLPSKYPGHRTQNMVARF